MSLPFKVYQIQRNGKKVKELVDSFNEASNAIKFIDEIKEFPEVKEEKGRFIIIVDDEEIL